MEEAFVARSQEIVAHFQVPFFAFPFGNVTVQVLRHVLGDGLGRVIDDHPNRPSSRTL